VLPCPDFHLNEPSNKETVKNGRISEENRGGKIPGNVNVAVLQVLRSQSLNATCGKKKEGLLCSENARTEAGENA
jgi:hypothetical protein